MRFVIGSAAIAAILLTGLLLKPAVAQSSANTAATPLILEKDDGEHRVRRLRDTPMATGPFIMKIDRKNGGSQKCGWAPRRSRRGD